MKKNNENNFQYFSVWNVWAPVIFLAAIPQVTTEKKIVSMAELLTGYIIRWYFAE